MPSLCEQGQLKRSAHTIEKETPTTPGGKIGGFYWQVVHASMILSLSWMMNSAGCNFNFHFSQGQNYSHVTGKNIYILSVTFSKEGSQGLRALLGFMVVNKMLMHECTVHSR